jgi:hypothetical protein
LRKENQPVFLKYSGKLKKASLQKCNIKDNYTALHVSEINLNMYNIKKQYYQDIKEKFDF